LAWATGIIGKSNSAAFHHIRCRRSWVSPLARNEREHFSFPLSRCPNRPVVGSVLGWLTPRKTRLAFNHLFEPPAKIATGFRDTVGEQMCEGGGESTQQWVIPPGPGQLVHSSRRSSTRFYPKSNKRNVDPKRLRTKKPISAGASAQVVRPQRRDTGCECAKKNPAPRPCGIFISLACV
jgi:hypothetical protein